VSGLFAAIDRWLCRAGEWLGPRCRRHRYPLAAGALAVLAAVVSLVVGTRVFPHLSLNHDEAVYLQQAAMLLEGQLFLHPPVVEAFEPWFFVEDGERIYPKYTPVAAAFFAVGKALGAYRFALAGLAAAAVALQYAFVASVFDRRVGVVAAGALLASPLFLVQSGLFLSYLPTTVLNLLFAVAYVRADETGDRRVAAVAGLAIGAAFFSRAYTAVLFAAPFIAHALWTLRRDGRTAVKRQGVVAAGGLLGVAVTLAYNGVVTGSPLLFPYEAFGPEDGLGFGHRELLGYEREYTPALAVEANVRVLQTFLTDWLVAGPVGTALAAVGLGSVLARARSRPDGWPYALVLASVVGTVALGNVYFWGNLNVLGAIDVAGDGFIDYFGPYYHFDLLVPGAAFAALGVVRGVERLRSLLGRRYSPARTEAIVVAVVLTGALATGGVAAEYAADPLAENAEYSANLDPAYEPLDREFSNALVFLPTPLGDWLHHPWQDARNDPGYDGPVVHALDHQSLAVATHFDDRTLYRYAYRGVWNPDERAVDATLQRVRLVEGDRPQVRATLGLPADATTVSGRLAADGETAYFTGEAGDETLPVVLTVANGTARVTGGLQALEGDGVTIDERTELRLSVFVERGLTQRVSYRLEVPVEPTAEGGRLLSPRRILCAQSLECDDDGASYLPGAGPDWVRFETRVDGG
jgi:hypothetical protein